MRIGGIRRKTMMEGHCHKDHNGLLFGDRNEMVAYSCVNWEIQQLVQYGIYCMSLGVLVDTEN